MPVFRLPNPLSAWPLLVAPLGLLTANYVLGTGFLTGEIHYGGYVHDTGRLAGWLLLVVLALTPLRLTFPGSRPLRRLAAQRRSLGLASFAYAAAHLIAYLARQGGARLLEDLAHAGFWTGWLAFLIFLPLALTSNDLSQRLMRRGWKRLHRLVHPAAILVLVHWSLTAFDPFLARCHLVALALIETWRLAMARLPRSAVA